MIGRAFRGISARAVGSKISRTFGSTNQIEALLADPDIDMVNICLPTFMHKSVSIAALQAGKHVLVEKPIEIRLDAANEVVRVGVESGVHFMVAHMSYRFSQNSLTRSR